MKIVIISNNDWDGLWYQRQQFATMYAERGHQVLFINKTLQRMPKLKDFKDRFTKRAETVHNPVPPGVKTLSIYTLPPLNVFRWLNRSIIRKKLFKTNFTSPDVLITYIPTYTALSIIDILGPQKTAYINVHNYDADFVVKDLLKAEREMCSRVNNLFADSIYNRNRLTRISGREVFDSLPGVHTAIFRDAFRGDEKDKRQTIVYFGGIGAHLDFSLYNQLADYYNVFFIGRFNSEQLRSELSPKIKVLSPIPNNELAKALRDVDIICILYRKSNYVDGVIPAKIYECLATLKPTIATGMGEMKSLNGVVYQSDNNLKSLNKIIDELPITETEACLQKRMEISESADWENRFVLLNKRMGINV
jgi:hypothetical protein